MCEVLSPGGSIMQREEASVLLVRSGGLLLLAVTVMPPYSNALQGHYTGGISNSL